MHDHDQGDAPAQDIVVTGIGLVSALGLTAADTWAAIIRGADGFGPLTALEQGDPATHTGGQAPPLHPDGGTPRSRETAYLRRAIRDALADAGLPGDPAYSPLRCSLVLGTTLHGMRQGGAFLRRDDVSLLEGFAAGAVARRAAEGLGLEGLNLTTCSACSSGLGATGLGMTLLRAGLADLVVAGGYDPISEYAYAGFRSLRLVTDERLRPFSHRRTGMKLAEGYAALVLERAPAAARRGAKARMRVAGIGESSDAHHLSQPHPEGEGAARAMHAAMAAAGVSPREVSMISAHATATPDNDAAEYGALKQVFGDSLPSIPVVAFKSHLGHTLGGAGAVELILSLLALEHGLVPPCAGLDPDECAFPDLAVVTQTPRRIRGGYALSTSLGFGGSNVCAVLAGPAAAPVARAVASRPPAVTAQPIARPVLITGVGVVLPGMVGNDAFARHLCDPDAVAIGSDTGAVAPADISGQLEAIGARRLRRVSDYVKYTLAATAMAYADAGIKDTAAFGRCASAVLGSNHGAATYSERYYRQLIDEGMAVANTLLFAEGVPNAGSAHVSMALEIRGGCQAIVGSRTAGLDALAIAAARIASGEWECAIVSAGEEYHSSINRAYEYFGLRVGEGSANRGAMDRAPGFATGSGAVTLILESEASAGRRGARARAAIGKCFGTLRAHSPSVRASREVSASFRALDRCDAYMTSMNATWLDRAQLDMLAGCAGTLSSLSGWIAETFSVTPLAGIAAVLLTGQLPRMRLRLPGRRSLGKLVPAIGGEPAGRVAVLAADYPGQMTALTLHCDGAS